VQKDSAICGTRKFGMCFMDKEGRLASIGTLLEIQEFAHMQVSEQDKCACAYVHTHNTFANTIQLTRYAHTHAHVHTCTRTRTHMHTHAHTQTHIDNI
jgi:hypothetical protein